MVLRLQFEGDDSVLLRVTHSNLKNFAADVRFSLQMSVEAVKDKLWKKRGTSVHSIRLELYNDCTFRKFKEKMASQNSSAFRNKVGDRYEVEPGEKRGVVKYVGRVEALGPGFWIGVQYDEPLGKHDGMVKGTRYFQCPPSCGGMVRPDKVKAGDYPERDLFEEDEI